MTAKKCLIVDDSRTIRLAIRRILEKFAFDITEAEHGEDALQKCADSMPDLVFLDWNMPVMDGLEFAQKFKSDPKSANTMVIFCTTNNDITQIQAALEAGATEFIMKPFDEGIIRSKLEQLGVLTPEKAA